MVHHCGAQGVVVALGRVDGLGTADLFRRLPEDAQGTGEAVGFHRRIGAQDSHQCGQSQGGMGAGVPGRPGMQALPGSLEGTDCWEFPGTESYPAKVASIGPPCPQVAEKAVGIPT